jgi:hypothetical protein
MEYLSTITDCSPAPVGGSTPAGSRFGQSFARWLAALVRTGGETQDASGELDSVFAYRLRSWPDLPGSIRKASILQSLTRMSATPVSHGWFVRHCGLDRPVAEELLERLAEIGSVHRIDLTRFSKQPQ